MNKDSCGLFTDCSSLKTRLTELNFCHDGVLKNVHFLKERGVDKSDGSIIFDGDNPILCDISVEMILNSYQGAKKDQVVLFKFLNVKQFHFSQNSSIDFSEIYEVNCLETGNNDVRLEFLCTKDKILSLSLTCNQIYITEE
jgi:hypothetical protein